MMGQKWKQSYSGSIQKRMDDRSEVEMKLL